MPIPRITNIRGPQGEKGDVGATGPKGEQGLRGLTGDKGDKGDKGEKGDTGATGPTGPQGLIGPQGEKGDKGDTGEKGEQGPQGERGLVGPQGERGEKGERGEQGLPGEKGEQGLQGPAGEKGEKGDKGDTGPQGAQGEKGETGAQGEKGDKGDKGDTGAPGTPGEQGPRGFAGEKGEKGDKGDTGPAGPQGEQGPQGLVGPQGPQGEKGERGLQGIPGPATKSRVNPDTKKWEYSEDDGETWISSNVEAIGPQGYSAYDIACENGFRGTEEEWLEDLRSYTRKFITNEGDVLEVFTGTYEEYQELDNQEEVFALITNDPNLEKLNRLSQIVEDIVNDDMAVPSAEYADMAAKDEEGNSIIHTYATNVYVKGLENTVQSVMDGYEPVPEATVAYGANTLLAEQKFVNPSAVTLTVGKTYIITIVYAGYETMILNMVEAGSTATTHTSSLSGGGYFCTYTRQNGLRIYEKGNNSFTYNGNIYIREF